jgi:ubiquinone/menaquinone biosynthesis C-methylase UbiE
MFKRNHYNFISPYYDHIASIIFRNKIFESQITFLNSIPNYSTILFIGGGSGKTLAKLLKLKPNCYIDYIDSSSKMIAKAKKYTSNNGNVEFIVGTENSIPNKKYNVVLTFFFLDLFKEDKLQLIHKTLNDKLEKDGLWLISDFELTKKWWQKIIKFCMFSFLKICTNIESDKILNFKELFKRSFYQHLGSKYYFGKLIFSSIYSKI